MKQKLLIFYILMCIPAFLYSQDIELYEQFNGRYDFTFMGNTMNENPNGPMPGSSVFYPCSVLTTSQAELNLNPDDVIVSAYLYWSGSGTGDFTVTLNGQEINAERTFSTSYLRDDIIFGGGVPIDTLFNVQRDFFGGFADVTELVQNTGNGTYTLSDLDITDVISVDGGAEDEYGNIYCRVAVNYAGWGVVVVYQNDNLLLNQLNIYDGFEFVNEQNSIALNLDNLNVVDNLGSKIGFLAWEGDANIAVQETLKVNGITLSNSLNPPNNAFNCTDTEAASAELWNMDMDVYQAQNYINIGDASAEVTLESGQDVIIMNAVVTKLNNQLPDATVSIDEIIKTCGSRTITVNYTVANTNSTDVLPAGTPVTIYLNGDVVATVFTQTAIAIGDTESGTITITIPDDAPNDFEILIIADDTGNGTGIVNELDESNNSFIINDSLWILPAINAADITACETEEGSNVGVFYFSGYEQSLQSNPTDIITFHITEDGALNGGPSITNPDNFTSTSNPQEIFVRLTDENGCVVTGSFLLIAENCSFPDATVVIDDIYKQCNSRVLHVHYTVNNFDSFGVLPAGTPVAIYADGQLIEFTETVSDLAVGESEEGFITVTIPIGIPLTFNLTFVADDIGDGTGIVVETDETNNENTVVTDLILSPVLQQPEDITECDTGFGVAVFDFSEYAQLLQNYPDEEVSFYTTQQNADQDIDRIYNTSAYTITQNPQRIYVRLDNGTCHTTASFLLITKKCAPTTYNYITPNGDGINDGFYVDGLRNIFLNFKMTIYNRWGNLIWTGDHSKADWDGIADVQKVGSHDTTVPTGTYYFVLELNDPDFPDPIVGWVYVTK